MGVSSDIYLYFSSADEPHPAPFTDISSMRKPAVPFRKQTVTPYALFVSTNILHSYWPAIGCISVL